MSAPVIDLKNLDRARRDAPRRARTDQPRVCFVGFNNLAVLAPQFDRRGAAGEPVQQTLLARAFARRGYDVSMVTADCGQPDGARWDGIAAYKAFAPEAGLPVIRFVHPRFTKLWSALRRADADVYYVSCAGAVVGQVALFCQVYKKRFVFRVASDADCARETLLIQYARDKRLYEYGLHRASGVLVQSAKQQQMLQQNFGVASMLAGMLVEQSGENLSFQERDIDVLWVSNIRELKRPDVLLSLAKALPGLSFHMVGGLLATESDYFHTIKAQAAQLPNLTFHGAVPYRDVSALYRRARVFVNTSDVEGFPNTYLQAWAAGDPVVAFFDPDDLIARSGLGSAVKSLAEMAQAVQQFAANNAAWKAASVRARAFIERAYGEDLVLEPYLQVIDPAAIDGASALTARVAQT